MASKSSVSLGLATLCLSIVVFSGCADRSELAPKIDYYLPSTRTAAPEPVYNRVMYSHLPAPNPLKTKENSPFLPVTISFEMPGSNLKEAVEALAQTIGYRWDYPTGLKNRAVSVKMVGRVDEVLQEISRQAGVTSEIDYDQRVVRVKGAAAVPRLVGKARGKRSQHEHQ